MTEEETIRRCEIAKDEIKTLVTTKFFNEIIKKLSFHSIINNNIYIKCDKNFHKEILVNSEYSAIFNRFFAPPYKIIFIFDSSEISENMNIFKKNTIIDEIFISEYNKKATDIIEKYLFSAVTSNIDLIYLTGHIGVGKTTVLKYFFDKYNLMFESKKNISICANDFAIQFYENISDSNKIENLKKKYMSTDLLILEDIHDFFKKEKIIEIFIQILTYLMQNKKKIIISSIDKIEMLRIDNNRLFSLLSSGVQIHILEANKVEIFSLIKFLIRTKFDNFFLDDSAIKYISNRVINYDLRKLNGMLAKIHFFINNNDKKIFSKKDVANILNDGSFFDIEKSKYNINPDNLISEICDFYNVKSNLVKSKSKIKNISFVRNVCIYVIKKKFSKLTLSVIGSFFSSRAHSTVIESINAISLEIEKNSELKRIIQKFINEI